MTETKYLEWLWKYARREFYGRNGFDALWAVTIAQDQLLKKKDAAILDFFNPDEAFKVKQEIVQRLVNDGKGRSY